MLVLALGLLVTAVGMASEKAKDQGRPGGQPPQSNVFGKSLSEWMELYFTWALGGDQADHVGHVEFLPIPNGEYTGGEGTPEDPAIFQGHLDVALEPGAAFVLPVAVWMGWTYDPDSGIPDDPPLDPSDFYGTVELDGRPIEVSYFEPVDFDPPIPLPPESYPGIATIYVQGLGFVHHPLAVGTHTLTLVSGMTSDYYNFGAGYENTWTITVRPHRPGVCGGVHEGKRERSDKGQDDRQRGRR
jgi:hypothetical protein